MNLQRKPSRQPANRSRPRKSANSKLERRQAIRLHSSTLVGPRGIVLFSGFFTETERFPQSDNLAAKWYRATAEKGNAAV